MYIIYESISNLDPRLEFIERYGDYWMYTVGYVKLEDEYKVNLSALNAIILSEDIAKASRFSATNVLKNDGKIKFRVADGGSEDLFPEYTLDDPSFDPKTKLLYTLTDDDVKNTVLFLQAMMTLELNNHYNGLPEHLRTYYSDKKQEIEKEISEIKDLLDAHRLLHNRFECECHNSQREAEELGSPKWDLSEPGFEIRLGQPRDKSDS